MKCDEGSLCVSCVPCVAFVLFVVRLSELQLCGTLYASVVPVTGKAPRNDSNDRQSGGRYV